ncbi:MAG: hypothetical protein JKX84_05490 [Flavobacteriales bacterium]|nr:hypothetical protein [Flavobacteriales bacterium]
MNIEQRKDDLISWVANLKNEGLLNRLEELKQASQSEIPDEILSLLEASNSVRSSDLVEHTSVKDLFSEK